jgi:hypothetical protein
MLPPFGRAPLWIEVDHSDALAVAGGSDLYGQKIGTAEELYFTGRSRLPERPSCYDGKQGGFLDFAELEHHHREATFRTA